MTRGGHDALDGERPGALAAEAEGYLLAHAHHEQIRREAAELRARLPWLTTSQAEELTGHYVRLRLDVSRQLLLGTVRRAEQLRAEYEDRYAALRRVLLRRHAAAACAVLACGAGVSSLAGVLPR
ncbi:hypothetical protein [Streptomyces sp. NPDC015242]|uniref:hypothetical protein n=1 Tax=Streptomyces sp. NPDC015242 TaxID=3364951 RepID=UPI0036F92CAC